MSEITVLPVQARDRAGKGAARAIRRQGLVPGVIYGDKQPPVLVAMDPRPLMAALRQPGFYSHQYDLDLNGEKHRVMAQDVQFHVVTDAPIHVDFLRVGKDTTVTTEITVRFINHEKSPGLKMGGTLNVVRHAIEVVGRPDDLPEDVVVDLTGVDLNETIHFSTITLPAGVKPTITDRDFTIANVVPPSGMKADGEEG